MGCSTSKTLDPAVVVYRPPPSSFAVFDIDAIKEPWLAFDQDNPNSKPKPAFFPDTILTKIETADVAPPRSWEEVSDALQKFRKPEPTRPEPDPNNSVSPPAAPPPSAGRDRRSFHTVDELDKKLATSKPDPPPPKPDPVPVVSNSLKQNPPPKPDAVPVVSNSLKQNPFIVRDRSERGTEAKSGPIKRDPLAVFPENCPPNGAESVVIYTTSLRGVRRTYEDCEKVKAIFVEHEVAYDERDVSLHGEFLKELKGLVGEEAATVPKVFMKGRYVGGAEEVVELNESGRLRRVLKVARVERGLGRQACEGCGGARFVPCFDCGGSCKVVVAAGEKQRCAKCNENGLVLCPLCL